MVWSKRARHAIHDGEYADLYRPFAQRRYRQELRAGSRCEKRTAGTARIASGIFDDLDVRR